MEKNTKQTLWIFGGFALLLFLFMLIYYSPIPDEGPIYNEEITIAQKANKPTQATAVQAGSQSQSKTTILDIVLMILIIAYLVAVSRRLENTSSPK